MAENVIIHLSKFPTCATQTVNPDVNYGLPLIRMQQHHFINQHCSKKYKVYSFFLKYSLNRRKYKHISNIILSECMWKICVSKDKVVERVCFQIKNCLCFFFNLFYDRNHMSKLQTGMT